MRSPNRVVALIDQEIRRGAWPNATTLARQLEVNPRTIHRDIDCLRDQLHAPLEFDRDHNGYHYSDVTFRLPLPQITEGEYLALFLAGKLLQEYRAAPVFADLVRLFEKINALLPEKISLNLHHLSETLSIRPPPCAPEDSKRFQVLEKAVQDGRRLEILYWSASRDATSRRSVDPYALTLADDWYLAAYCHLREEVRLFATSRIRELHETGDFFERPADFSLNDYLDDGLRKFRGVGQRQTYRLRFSPQVARYVRDRTWHRSQQIEELADGGLILSLQVNHSLEVKRWAMSWGADCEVLKPEELRQEMQAELLRTLNVYQAEVELAHVNP